MTIKTTLAYGRNFHFYQEGLSNTYVYLELEDVPYDAGYRRVMVAIPIDVWEAVRHLGAARLDLGEASDEELLELVRKIVDQRISEHERSRTASPERAELHRFDNSIIFGAKDDAREQQIARGLEYYKIERERQRSIVERLAQHKVIDIDDSTGDEKSADT